ncbi:MAG: DUF2339 domain-containing protein [Halioglobus sp.]
MENLLYLILALLAGAAFLGGLFSWVTYARLRRLEQRLEQLHLSFPPTALSVADADPWLISDPGTPAVSQTLPDDQTKSTAQPENPEPVAPRQHAKLTPREAIWWNQIRKNWMIWLGGLCIALAGIFLVKYSMDAGLLGPRARIILACLIGISLHGAAEYLRQRTGENHPSFAALAGGASITLYAAMLAALHLYQLMDVGLVFLLLAVIALITMALAVIHGPILAVIGILGAYVVPILVSSGQGDIVSALIYSLIISGAALLLLRYVYRPWLWFGTVAGAIGWWLISFENIEAEAVRGYYLAILAYGVLAIPTGDWLLQGAGKSKLADTPNPTRASISIMGFSKRLRFKVPVITLTLLVITLAQAFSIASQGFDSGAFSQWSPLVLILVLAARYQLELAVLPWISLACQWFAWLISTVEFQQGQWQLAGVAEANQDLFLWYAAFMAALYTGLSLWLSRGQPYQRLSSSLAALAPVCWLALAYLLVSDLAIVWQWSLISMAMGLTSIILSQRQLRRQTQEESAVWLILGAHLAYSLAVAMLFREATLTLALAVQLISITWLIRRYQLERLDWLVKMVLALIAIRLTFNPWMLSYPADIHWSLWTYGGAMLCCIVASVQVPASARLKPWLEAVSLQLLVLFVAAETRYQLYDGQIFNAEYSLTEAAINTALWSGLGMVYYYRVNFSAVLATFYTKLSTVLMIMACANYWLVLTLLNPLWGDQSVSQRPVFNLLLLAYGLPPVIALLAYRYFQPRFQRLAAGIAAIGGLIFISIEIRHLWQGQLAIRWHTSDGELYTYSAVWLAIAFAAILYASRRQLDSLYRGGMALLIVVIAKLFLIDMAGLEGLWRVASFMGLGLSLLGLAFLYQRTSINDQPLSSQESAGG